MRRVAESLATFQKTAGPAGTLLVVTVLLVLATSLARATPDRAALRVESARSTLPTVSTVVAQTPERVAAGDVFDIAVELDAPRDLQVYLPGLDQVRVPLAYDPFRGVHFAELTLPWFAPPQGYCTLRIIDGHGLEVDVRLELSAPSQT